MPVLTRNLAVGAMILIFVLGAGVGAVVGFAAAMQQAGRPQALQTPPDSRPLVETVAVPVEEAAIGIRTQGVVRVRGLMRLAAEVGGVVTTVSPKLAIGGRVAAGEVLVVVDDSNATVACAAARARLAVAERLLLEEEVRARQAVVDWRRLHGEAIADPLVLRTPQVAAAVAERDAARAASRDAEHDLACATIRAPDDGRVVSRLVEPGNLLLPGMMVAELQPVDAVEVELDLGLESLEWLDLPLDGLPHPGPSVELTAEVAGRRAAWTGRVERIVPALDDRTRRLQAICRVERPLAADPPLLPGTFVEAVLTGRTHPGVRRLPAACLQAGGMVFEVDGQDTLIAHPVRTIQHQGGTVLVDGRLTTGGRLVVTPLPLGHAGMRVRSLAAAAAAPAGGN